jgi:ABC-type multidrug transport system ATPase subunit
MRVSPDPEATDAAPATAAPEPRTPAATQSGNGVGRPESIVRRPTTGRRKPVPPVHGGATGVSPAQPASGPAAAEQAAAERARTSERVEPRPASRPSSDSTRPTGVPVKRPVEAARADVKSSAVREPVARDSAAATTVAGTPAPEAAEAAVVAEEATATIPRARPAAIPKVSLPRRAPKKQKGPEAGAVRPVETPRQRIEIVLAVNDLVKRFGSTTAVAGISLQVRAGSFFGLVGPNGAGKTTTLSMVTGLLRPDSGSVIVHGADVWNNPVVAKRNMGVLPDSLRLFDRLTGAQLLYYSGVLRGLDAPTVHSRTVDLAAAFGLTDALDRLVTDYSAGMTKKIALAAAMIHSPRLLVLDEPFESVDPVSAANVTEILQRYVAAGGTVVLSSHSMDLIQRICDDVAIVVNGQILATGGVDEVRGESTLEERFVELAGGRRAAEGMEWLHSFSD